jgi:hypothetical protein
MPIERIEQRILGALRLTDRVMQRSLTRPLHLTSNKARLVRNSRGYYVVTHATGLDRHIASFKKIPAAPALESRKYRFIVTDPLGYYLPRLLELRLPRDPDPGHAENGNSLFKTVDVAMYPASTAPLLYNWSSLRISVARAANNSVVRGALLRVIDVADDRVLASGISDKRGEALVIVPGVPITKFADEEDEGDGGGASPVVVNTLPVRLELSLGVTTPWPVNPDLLEQNHDVNRRMSVDLALSTGRMERVVINLA